MSNETYFKTHGYNLENFAAMCHSVALESGFWDDAPRIEGHTTQESWAEACRNYIALKIMLVVSELGEAIEELRKFPANDLRVCESEQYYPTLLINDVGELPDSHVSNNNPAYGEDHEVVGQLPVENPNWGEHKPEGVTVELADAVIRLLDLLAWDAGLAEGEEGELTALFAEKLTYNASRGYKHGKTC